MIFTLIFGVFGVLLFVPTNGQMRDEESGVLNLFEISKMADTICEKERKIRGLLKNPFLFGAGIRILRFPIPLLPGPSRITALYVLESLIDRLSYYEDLISAYLENTTPAPTKESLTQHPNHTNIEIDDLLSAADFVCRTTHLWFDIIASKLSDLIGLWHIRLPIPDFQHRLTLHALDFLDILGITDRLRRFFSGQLGLPTTTKPPSLFSSFFQQKKSTTTSSHGLLSSLFNPATTPTTKKPGLFDSLIQKPTSTKTPSTTKHAGLFSSLFQKPSTTTRHPTTTKSSGLFSNLFGGSNSKSKTSTNATVKPVESPVIKFSKQPHFYLTTTFGRDPSQKSTAKFSKPNSSSSTTFGHDPSTSVTTNNITRGSIDDVTSRSNVTASSILVDDHPSKIILPTSKTYTINLDVLDYNATKYNRKYAN